MNGLKKLSMLIDDKQTGLYYLGQEDIDNNHISFCLEEAIPYNPTAIYVTQLENQPPKPQIYIYDNTNDIFSQEDIMQIHKELWNSAKVPLFFIFEKTEVKIYNCRKNIDNNFSAMEILYLASATQKELNKIKIFDAKMFDSGMFWNQEKYAKEFEFKYSVYDVLLNDLKDLREKLISKSKLSQKVTESLLIKSILIKYLDERGVFNQKKTNNYWSKFLDDATTFTELFNDSSAIVKLFDSLKNHFNGGIFDISDEKEELLSKDLGAFKEFLEADTEVTQNRNKQKLLWSKYSFKDLPVELISNIYELFLKSEEKETNGIVYTPPILVDFIIDEIMPLEKPQKSFKLIDPSCGSGIFLVAAYKRLIQWWRVSNSWNKPTIPQAQKIIRESIFGVDKEEGAVEVSLFSLSLALCDTFLPDEIWDSLKFEDLRKKNIMQKDFFEYIQNTSNHNIFDLVIGNPPFVSEYEKWTVSTKELDNKEIEVRPLFENKPLRLPDKQLALFFLEQSFKLLKKDGYVSLVQPSAFIYNNGVFNFRNYLFEKYKCHQVIDFSCIKKLFNTANVATSVVFMQNKNPDLKKDLILHLTVRQTFLVREKIYFDLSHYDFHWLKYQNILEQKSIWKCNLLGGSRVKIIISRLEKYDTIGLYIEKKKKLDYNQRWFAGDGYQEGKEDKKINPASWITGHNLVPPEAFTSDGIDNEQLIKVEDKKFQWTREPNKKIFEQPHLLIKKQLDGKNILCEYRDDYLTFKNTIYGIHAPKQDKQELKNLEKYLKENGKMLLFYLATTSPRALIYKATSLLQKDFNNMPFIQEDTQLKLSKVEQYFVDDILDYMIDFCKVQSSILLKNTMEEQIEKFQEVYCELLNTVYKDVKPLGFKETNSYIFTAFYYKNKPLKTLLDEETLDDSVLTELVKDKIGKHIHMSRILRFYDEDIIYLIKPKQYRFWLKSIAVRDADETFADLVKMGY